MDLQLKIIGDEKPFVKIESLPTLKATKQEDVLLINPKLSLLSIYNESNFENFLKKNKTKKDIKSNN